MNLPSPSRPRSSSPTHDAGSAIKRLSIESSHAILDLGCGDGHHSAAITRRMPAIFVDLDFSLEQLATLARNGSDRAARSYVCADALALPFRPETFDRVVCSLVFYLLPLERAFQQLSRLLKPGGRAYLRVPMLAPARAAEIFKSGTGWRDRLYRASHVANGLFFLLTGRQARSPFVRHDRWACYVPRRRFEEAVRRAGLRIETLEVDYPRPRTPSIDAWVVKG